MSAMQRTGLSRLDVDCLDHFAPLLGFVGDELAEIGRGQRKHSAAEVGEPRLQLRIGKARIDLDSHTLWRAHAVPRGHLVACDKLAYARNVR